MSANQAQREQWNDESQAQTWPRRERITVEVTPLLIKRLAPQPGERILEVGSGGGLAAMELAKAVGADGRVVGFDLSAPLVGLATTRASEAGATNVRFVAGDAQTDDIPGAPFDAATSQFGVMFFADPIAAFKNIRRHLRPGARFAFACWQAASENPWFPGTVLGKYAPPPASPPEPAVGGGPPPGPWAFGDADYVRGILDGAGFSGVTCEPQHLDVTIPEDSIYDRSTLKMFNLEGEKAEAAWKDLQTLAASFKGADGMLHLEIAPHLVSAINSA